jgi:hypothetical protein
MQKLRVEAHFRSKYDSLKCFKHKYLTTNAELKTANGNKNPRCTPVFPL